MYAGGTGGLASSGGVIGRVTGTSCRCQQSRSHAATAAMTRPTGESRFTCGMASGSQGGDAGQIIGGRARQRWPATSVVVERSRSRLSRDAVAAQPGTHSSSAPGVAPADRESSSVLVMVKPSPIGCRVTGHAALCENPEPDRQLGMGISPRTHVERATTRGERAACRSRVSPQGYAAVPCRSSQSRSWLMLPVAIATLVSAAP